MLGDARLAVEFADEMLGKECSVYLFIYVFSGGGGEERDGGRCFSCQLYRSLTGCFV